MLEAGSKSKRPLLTAVVTHTYGFKSPGVNALRILTVSCAFCLACKKVKDDRTMLVSMLREAKAGVALEHASERLRNDKAVVLAAVKG
jgi:hypothetical protein